VNDNHRPRPHHEGPCRCVDERRNELPSLHIHPKPQGRRSLARFKVARGMRLMTSRVDFFTWPSPRDMTRSGQSAGSSPDAHCSRVSRAKATPFVSIVVSLGRSCVEFSECNQWCRRCKPNRLASANSLIRRPVLSSLRLRARPLRSPPWSPR
jgi:hypothetical protein